LIVAFARTANQAGVIGSAIAMVLSAVGGNFFPRFAFPAWLRTLSLIGPNAWSIEGFQKLSAGATLFDLRFELLALAVMTAVFFGIATLGFRRIVR
jgi:ABC-2 type transport system permease protein